MPGWPPENESIVIPVELWWNLEWCVYTPLPAVPDQPIVFPYDSEYRTSMP